ncbi:MAG: [FeFe] hydrogenase H-cluster radical SAM maturase HydE [Oscillospiraceae bacterium]
MFAMADRLESTGRLAPQEFEALIQGQTPGLSAYVQQKAQKIQKQHYGNDIYIRGLIEFTNYCKNNCYYCGIRLGNKQAQRYRLTKQQILECCAKGYELGFRTFVLQGGEDPFYTDDAIADIVTAIKTAWPNCALTLSIGEHEKEAYRLWKNAGADRYLLRHETANPAHYAKLHPKSLSLQHRKQCLWNLKELGYQVGTGDMVGSPEQTAACLAEDFAFIHELQPHMVGIGPFIAHHDTPFAGQPGGSLEVTTYLLGLLRLMLPSALLPATTALGTIHPSGRERGILAGANVVMPNLSPTGVRAKYLLYDNKICTGDEAAECRYCMENRMKSIGYQVVVHRGDYKAP